eukprot:6359984-Amphidinium_carterae.1
MSTYVRTLSSSQLSSWSVTAQCPLIWKTRYTSSDGGGPQSLNMQQDIHLNKYIIANVDPLPLACLYLGKNCTDFWESFMPNEEPKIERGTSSAKHKHRAT